MAEAITPGQPRDPRDPSEVYTDSYHLEVSLFGPAAELAQVMLRANALGLDTQMTSQVGAEARLKVTAAGEPPDKSGPQDAVKRLGEFLANDG